MIKNLAKAALVVGLAIFEPIKPKRPTMKLSVRFDLRT